MTRGRGVMVKREESVRTNVKQSRKLDMDCFVAMLLAMTRGRGGMVESVESLRTNVKQSRKVFFCCKKGNFVVLYRVY